MPAFGPRVLHEALEVQRQRDRCLGSKQFGNPKEPVIVKSYRYLCQRNVPGLSVRE